MEWKNLKSMLCPKCGAKLLNSDNRILHEISSCSFHISKERFDSLLEQMYHPQRTINMRKNTIDENLEALNNFGTKPITEDFNDSPFLDY